MLAQSRSVDWVASLALPLAARSAHCSRRRATRCRSSRQAARSISLFATANTVPVNGEIEIVATAIENGTTRRRRRRRPPRPRRHRRPRQRRPRRRPSTSTPGAGTPVQNGTVITFTTTLGRIEPADARTNNGQVRVRFISSSGQSGVATITAFSGGASGKLENLRVGTAAAERVLLSATPQCCRRRAARPRSPRGSKTSAAPGCRVSRSRFTAIRGSSVPGPSTTDSNGVARTTSARRRATTIVTANVAGKTATVTVNLNRADRRDHHRPDHLRRRRDTGDLHRRRRSRTGQHSGCHDRLRRRRAKLARRDQRVDAGPAHLHRGGNLSGVAPRRPKRAASRRPLRLLSRSCRSSRRA